MEKINSLYLKTHKAFLLHKLDNLSLYTTNMELKVV